MAVLTPAEVAGYDDVLFVDAAGHVSEGAAWNVGFFDGEQVVLPRHRCSPDTRELPVSVADAQGLTVAFATNAVVGVRAIASIDDVVLPRNDDLIETSAAPT